MSNDTSYIRDGYCTVTPSLRVVGAADFLNFAQQVFGAEEMDRTERPDGSLGYAAVRLGDSLIEVSEANEEWGPMPAGLHIYLPDTDATYRRALDAGATSLHEPMDHFYGERGAAVRDPWGIDWYLATFQRNVPSDEMKAGAEAHWGKAE